MRLDVREAAIEDRGGLPAIVPGDREKSEVWKRIVDSDDPMPPVKSHKFLTAGQIELIGRWIDEGAVHEEHWAYVKPERPPLPENDEQAAKVAPVEDAYQAILRAHPEAAQVEEHLASRNTRSPLPGGKIPEYGEEFKKNHQPARRTRKIRALCRHHPPA